MTNCAVREGCLLVTLDAMDLRQILARMEGELQQQQQAQELPDSGSNLRFQLLQRHVAGEP